MARTRQDIEFELELAQESGVQNMIRLLEDELEDFVDEDEMDESMDGDHASALASAGFGTDEDYEHNDIDSMDFDYDQPESFDYPEED